MKILIVDDNAAMRSALRRTIEARTTFDIVGEATNGLEGVDLAEELSPDVILMDISMPVMDGIQATTIIKKRWPGIIVLAFSGAGDLHSMDMMVEAGASGYVVKGETADELLYSLRRVTLPATVSLVEEPDRG